MAIANGSTVLTNDLNAMLSSALAAIQADNAQLPAGLELNLSFPNLVAATPAEQRKAIFVAPFDLLVESIAVQSTGFTAASTLTVAVTADGPVANWPMTISGTVGVATVKLARLLYDNTKTNPAKSFATTSRAFRVFPRGSTITVLASTNSIAAGSLCTATSSCANSMGETKCAS
jgi:hypothetical protein